MTSNVSAIPLDPNPLDTPEEGHRLGDCTHVFRCFYAGAENALFTYLVNQFLNGGVLGGPQYQPFVLVGASGCGKSHVAAGIASTWRLRQPSQRVLAISSDDFNRRCHAAWQLHDEKTWHARFRLAHLLVLEDVHRLSRPTVQQELSAMLDERHAHPGPTTLVTSAVTPSQAKGFLPSLASRLASGLVVQLRPPDVATRRKILAELAKHRGLDITDDGLDRLAQELTGTTPLLRGAILQLDSFLEQSSDGRPRPIDEPATRAWLDQHRTQRPTARAIIHRTARYFDLTPRQLTSKCRRRQMSLARAIAIYLIREVTGASFEHIGQLFSNRDHSTTMYAYQRIGELAKTDGSLRRALDDIRQHLTTHVGKTC